MMKIECVAKIANDPKFAEQCRELASGHIKVIEANPLLLFAIAIALLVVSYVITSMLIKQPKVKPAALEDWDFPQADDGTPQAVFFGDCWATGPMIVWYGNYRTIKIKADGGKK